MGKICFAECSEDYKSCSSIIWCYDQWQQSYFDMLKTVPEIEFNKGIPDDIDNTDYLDVSQRNLIVLDISWHNPAKINVFLIF
jgi:hypothetical protein